MRDFLFAIWADKAMLGSKGVRGLMRTAGHKQDLRETRSNKILKGLNHSKAHLSARTRDSPSTRDPVVVLAIRFRPSRERSGSTLADGVHLVTFSVSITFDCKDEIHKKVVGYF